MATTNYWRQHEAHGESYQCVNAQYQHNKVEGDHYVYCVYVFIIIVSLLLLLAVVAIVVTVCHPGNKLLCPYTFTYSLEISKMKTMFMGLKI